MRGLIFLLFIGLSGCACISTYYSSAGHDSRIQFVVIHYTASDLDRSLGLLSGNNASSHYLIDTRGKIYRLVAENRRAWHAGESSWQGRTFLNSSSIGIELVNNGYTELAGRRYWEDFSETQIKALIRLLKDIKGRHGITPDRIIGHSDIAPQRKVDPGPLFPWKKLADAGLTVWPNPETVNHKLLLLRQTGLPDIAWFQFRLADLGYSVPLNGTEDEETTKVIQAFQMKYRPTNFSGIPDMETAALLDALASGAN